MAGTSAKCSCGQVISIPSAGNPSGQPSLTVLPDDPLSANLGAIPDDPLGPANLPMSSGYLPGRGPAHLAYRASGTTLSPTLRRNLIWGGVLGGVAIVLLIGVFGIVRLAGNLARSVRDTIEPEWVADASLVSQLQPEQEVGSYALRPHPVWFRNPGGTGKGDVVYAEHVWLDSRMQTALIVVLLTASPDMKRNSLRDHAQLLVRQNRDLPRWEMVGDPVFDRGRIGDQAFVRATYQMQAKNIFIAPCHIGGSYNRLWVGDDGPVRIIIQLASMRPFDDPAVQLADAAVCTWHKRPDANPATSPPGSAQPPGVSSPSTIVRGEGWTPPSRSAQASTSAASPPPLPPPNDEEGAIVLEDLVSERSFWLPRGAGVLYATSPAPYALLDTSFYRLTDGQLLGRRPSELRHLPSRAAISPDGSMFAMEQDNRICVFTVDGQTAFSPWPIDSIVGEMQFVDNQRLLVRSGRETWLYEATTGRLLCSLPRGPGAASPDAKLYAAATYDDVYLYDLGTGQQTARLLRPPAGQAQAFSNVDAIAFSPDGRELAVLLGEPRLVCWSCSGEIVLDQTLPRDWEIAGHRRVPLGWIPDGRGWLLYEQILLDKQTGRPTVVLRPSLTTDIPYHFLDTRRLVIPREGRSSDNKWELITVGLPWDRIQASQQALASGAGLLGRGKAVSVRLDVKEVRFASVDQTRSQLMQSLLTALSDKGVRVAERGDVQLRVTYREQQGETMEYAQGDSIAPFSRVTKGPVTRVSETIGLFSMELQPDGAGRPLWSRTLRQGATSLIMGQVNDSKAREAMFARLLKRIDSAEMPYYVPSDDGQLTLPLVIDLRTAFQRQLRNGASR